MNRTEFHNWLGSQPVGTRAFIDENTEIENLGDGRFAASIGGLQVFKDVDGQWRKHRLLDLRPEGKGVVLQSAKCCVELHGYYAKFYNPTYTKVRIGEERFAVEGFDTEDSTWKIVLVPSPTLPPSNVEIEEGANFVRAQATYENENGVLTLEYFQQDARPLKHNITFQSKISGTVRFRVIHRWNKIRFRRLRTIIEKREITGFVHIGPQRFLTFFRQDDRREMVQENFNSLYYLDEATGEYETDILKAIVADIEEDPVESKIYFIYGNWTLNQSESLTIDPATTTLSDPTEDGYLHRADPSQYDCPTGTLTRIMDSDLIELGGWSSKPNSNAVRGYVEWDISSLAGVTVVAPDHPIFKYHGNHIWASDEEIHPITNQPSVTADATLWADIASGLTYAPNGVADPATIIAGPGQEIQLNNRATLSLQAAINVPQSWWAIGLQSPDDECPPRPGTFMRYSSIYSEEKAGPAADPPPSLFVIYTPPAPEGGGGEGAVAEIGVKSLILELLLEGVI